MMVLGPLKGASSPKPITRVLHSEMLVSLAYLRSHRRQGRCWASRHRGQGSK